MEEYIRVKTGVVIDELEVEIAAEAGITPALDCTIYSAPNDLHLFFVSALSGAEEATLDTLIAAHPNVKQHLKNNLANYRWLKEEGGIVWGGIPIRTDERSRTLLSGIQPKIDRDNDDTITKRVKTEVGFQTLTHAQLKALYADVADHYQKCFDAEDLVIPLIDDGTLTTNAAVEAEFDTQYAAL
jgi:hypothetical protein